MQEEKSQFVKLMKFKFLPFLLLAAGFIECSSSPSFASKDLSLDDVFSNGGSFNEMRLFIEKNGGKVVHIVAMSLGGQ
jgi:hypothetical protein